jgi:hypothetical protein
MSGTLRWVPQPYKVLLLRTSISFTVSATYKGHKWVGKISEVFMETWVQDAGGRAVRQGNGVQAGQLQLSFGDILPPDYPHTITLDLDEFHNGLKERIQQLAAHRCREMVSEWVKHMGDRQSDRNYPRVSLTDFEGSLLTHGEVKLPPCWSRCY